VASRDTASDQRGFVIPLDDGDLTRLIKARRDGDARAVSGFLRKQFEQLVM
jgi:hypothetical protein